MSSQTYSNKYSYTSLNPQKSDHTSNCYIKTCIILSLSIFLYTLSYEITNYSNIPNKINNLQLPFCVLLKQKYLKQQALVRSILNQNYSNYKIGILAQAGSGIDANFIYKQYGIYAWRHKYKGLKYLRNFQISIIKGDFCEWTDIILRPTTILEQSKLNTLNKIYQSTKNQYIWGTIEHYKFEQQQNSYSYFSSFYLCLLVNFQDMKLHNFLKSMINNQNQTDLAELQIHLGLNKLIKSKIYEVQQQILPNDYILKSQLISSKFIQDIQHNQQISNFNHYQGLKYLPNKYININYNALIQTHPHQLKLINNALDKSNLPQLSLNHSMSRLQKIKYQLQYPQYQQYNSCSQKFPSLLYNNRICIIIYFDEQEASRITPQFIIALLHQVYSNFYVIIIYDCLSDISIFNIETALLFIDQKIEILKVNNPSYLGKLESLQFILENRLYFKSDIVLFYNGSDVPVGNYVTANINMAFNKQKQVWGVFIKRLSQYIEESIIAVRTSLLLYSNIINRVLSQKKSNKNLEVILNQNLAKICQGYLTRIQQIEFLSNREVSINLQQKSQLKKQSDSLLWILDQQFLTRIRQTYFKDIKIQKQIQDEEWEKQQKYDVWNPSKYAVQKQSDSKPLLQYTQFASQTQIQQFISKISTNAEQVQSNFNKTMFAKNMWLNQDDQKYKQIEYYYYDQNYNISKHIPQRQICLIASYYNMLSYRKYTNFIQTINEQNYTNYRVIIIDDASIDNSANILKQIIKNKFPKLLLKTVIIKQHKNIGLVGNKLIGANYCNQSSILFDVDADDCFIGRQVFNLVNHLYSDNPQKWLIHLNYLGILLNGQLYQGASGPVPQQLLINKQYRYSDLWVTSHLKTMLWKLFIKIGQAYPQHNFTKHATDRQIMYGAIQMAGSKRVLYVDENVYLYYWSYMSICSLSTRRRDGRNARIQIPLQTLQNLQQKPKFVKDIEVPEENIMDYRKAVKDLKECQKRLEYRKKEC